MATEGPATSTETLDAPTATGEGRPGGPGTNEAEVPPSGPAGSKAARSRPPRRRSLWLGPAALVVVVAIALLVGSGALSSRPQTPAQRAAALETTIRCPSCIDVSAADSSAGTAVALRHEILRWEREGYSAQRIDAILVGRYGPDILLTPPSGGLTDLLWIIPVVAGAAAVAILGTVFWRRNRELGSWREGSRSSRRRGGEVIGP